MKSYSNNLKIGSFVAILLCSAYLEAAQNQEQPSSFSPYLERDFPTKVLWGDTHLHTSNSVDAFASGTRLDAEAAYRFARGEEVTTSTGLQAKLARPLDFLLVADHAEAFGVIEEVYEGNESLMVSPVVARWSKMMNTSLEQSQQVAEELKVSLATGTVPKVLANPKVTVPIIRSAWADHLAIAERYNEPGKFTSLLGYEWTSAPNGNNLHRVVMFRDNPDLVGQKIPFSALQSENPERLWAFLAKYKKDTGGNVLAIPHNSNLSGGQMFARVDFDGNPLDAGYAKERAKWEPVIEITQFKGDSESHPMLSPNDEYASYGDAGWELANLQMSSPATPESIAGSYVREGLKRGLELQDQVGTNPFQYGFIGSTDSHTSLANPNEDNFFGNVGSEPRANRFERVIKKNDTDKRFAWQYLAGGYAAVWAHENTREAIWDAFARREVYATTGTRMTVRVFAGWEFEAGDEHAPDLAQLGYAKGVPMGSELSKISTKSAPSFLVAAQKDVMGANLDRVQMIKAWVDNDGKAQEKIYEIVWSDQETRKLDGKGKLPSVGNTVNVKEASWINSIGATQLATVWRDPDFKPDQAALYYVRVLEIPTPRWTAYDAKRFGVDMPAEVPMTTQERAYTSPIWYTP